MRRNPRQVPTIFHFSASRIATRDVCPGALPAALECSMPPLTESEFLVLAGKALDRLEADIETAADAADADVEINRTGNVMELEFEDGSKIIVNSQAPMQELWVAAKAGGFHFRHDGAKWMDTRSGAELYAALSTYMSQQAGVTLTLG